MDEKRDGEEGRGGKADKEREEMRGKGIVEEGEEIQAVTPQEM